MSNLQSLEVQGPSGPQLLVGDPWGLLTSSLAPFENLKRNRKSGCFATSGSLIFLLLRYHHPDFLWRGWTDKELGILFKADGLSLNFYHQRSQRKVGAAGPPFFSAQVKALLFFILFFVVDLDSKLVLLFFWVCDKFPKVKSILSVSPAGSHSIHSATWFEKNYGQNVSD